MCDSAATPPQRTAKKLPFKATALPKAASLKVETIDNEKESENDGLDLFRRSKEMEPIMAADQERRLKKRRRHEDQRRKSAGSSAKRPVDKITERYVMAKAKSGASSQAARSTVPVASELVMPGEALARLVYAYFLFLDTGAHIAYTC